MKHFHSNHDSQETTARAGPAFLRSPAKRRRIVLTLLFLAALGVAVGFIPVGGTKVARNDFSKNETEVTAMNLSSYSKDRPKKSLHLLFIHHSTGGQLMADFGQDNGQSCIYQTNANGGGLRALLQKEGYIVHEASYDSEVGDKTDIFDWPRKFKEMMDKVLLCDHQNTYFKDGTKNQIVVFKSCFPQNDFVGIGQEPGNPSGPDLTVANAKAAYDSLLPEFAKYPETLFVAMTAPPLVGHLEPEPLWKHLARVILRRTRTKPSTAGHLARQFNNWLKSEKGWLSTYDRKNVVVFDYYDILTDYGKSNYAEFPSGNGNDSHPNTVGNTKAALVFLPFLNQVVRRAGLE
ncbi:MAG: hypothetical protein A4E59_00245 [Syntrophorhabdus sp. PtaB.Bin027]|jgi:hypothetical protein|nr:MAG: hypothetical protein A4E59_00245 [Syntrophorhabdus sp. PtaB.Bin027]HOD79167.1 hypothetical protein [Syntrophorhabdus sp.]